MKRSLKSFGFALVLLLFASNAFPADTPGGTLVIENFETLAVGRIPRTWRTWPLQRGKATKVYSVQQEEGNRFLHADDREFISVQLLRNFNWNVGDLPLLSWRWRAIRIPKGAREDRHPKNDSACAVYVTIGYVNGKALKYVWSSDLAPDTIVCRSPDYTLTVKDKCSPSDRMVTRVLDGGAKEMGKWNFHRVDVVDDFKKYFGIDLDGTPRIAVLTDGNADDIKQRATCDYDDFAIAGAARKGPHIAAPHATKP